MKKNIIKISLLLSAFCFMVSATSCQHNDNSDKDTHKDDNSKEHSATYKTADSAAKGSLEVLKAMAGNDKLKGSFPLTAEQVSKLAIGEAVPVMEVSYMQLLQLSDSGSLKGAIMPDSKMLYPLQMDREVKASAMVSGSGDAWKLANVGVGGHVELLNMRAAITDKMTAPARILEIPGITLNAIVYDSPNGTMFVPDNTIPDSRIVKGQAIPEAEFTKAIISYARFIEQKYGKEINDKHVVD